MSATTPCLSSTTSQDDDEHPSDDEQEDVSKIRVVSTSMFGMEHLKKTSDGVLDLHEFKNMKVNEENGIVEVGEEVSGVAVESYKTMTLKISADDVQTQKKKLLGSVSNVTQGFANLTKSLRNITAVENYETSEVKDFLVKLSWFEGTTTDELHAHVEQSIERELQQMDSSKSCQIEYFQLYMEGGEGLQEVVLSPHLPSNMTFLVKYELAKSPRIVYRSATPAPESPSAAPNTSPKFVADPQTRRFNSFSLDGIRQNQMSIGSTSSSNYMDFVSKSKQVLPPNPCSLGISASPKIGSHPTALKSLKDHSNTPLITGKMDGERVVVVTQTPQQEKQHVIFTIANYFVLFLSIIVISAELAERAPVWIERNISQVTECALDQDTLYECINNGDAAGVVAAIGLWLARSGSSKRFLLFGFSSVGKLWTVIYESFVTAFCWGFSYVFIRRGLNPDTRENLLRRYWKDAVYGSLAGFNASFMKAVLKNLIPKEAIEEAVLETKQLRLVDWLIKAGK